MKEFTRRLFVQKLEERRLLAGDLVDVPQSDQPPAEIAVASDRGDSDREPAGESMITVRLDFRFDESNFFTTRFPQARAVMQEVVDDIASRFNDTFNAITPPPRSEITWTPRSFNPIDGTADPLPQNFRVEANELVVFVRGDNLTGNTRGRGGFNTIGFGASCSGPDTPACIAEATAYRDNLRTRGETGAGSTPATDFVPPISAITIDSRPNVDWNFGPVGTGEPGENDFRALVAHEFAHAIGFGTAPSFTRYLAGGTFNGPNANEVYPGPGNVPMQDNFHLADSVLDVVPTTLTEEYRGLLSELDFAILEDIGWDVIADTRPTVDFAGISPVVAESAGTVTVTANLSSASNQSVTVPVVISGTASANSDYTLSPNAFTFPAGQRIATIAVNIVDNVANEAIESLTVRLQDSAAAKLGSITESTVTILDDDDSSAEQVNLRSPEFTSAPLQIPGDGDPAAFLFRATTNSTMQVSRVGNAVVNEAFFVLNDSLEPIGTYEGVRALSVPVVAGRSYALVFQGRMTAEQYSVESSAGYTAIANRSPTNLLQPADVSGDGEVSALDALRVINQLNASGATEVDANDPTLEPDNYFDVSRDGKISALDALRVINALSPVSDAGSEPPLAPQTGTFHSTTTRNNRSRVDSIDVRAASSRSAAAEPFVSGFGSTGLNRQASYLLEEAPEVDEIESTSDLNASLVDELMSRSFASS